MLPKNHVEKMVSISSQFSLITNPEYLTSISKFLEPRDTCHLLQTCKPLWGCQQKLNRQLKKEFREDVNKIFRFFPSPPPAKIWETVNELTWKNCPYNKLTLRENLFHLLRGLRNDESLPDPTSPLPACKKRTFSQRVRSAVAAALANTSSQLIHLKSEWIDVLRVDRCFRKADRIADLKEKARAFRQITLDLAKQKLFFEACQSAAKTPSFPEEESFQALVSWEDLDVLFSPFCFMSESEINEKLRQKELSQQELFLQMANDYPKSQALFEVFTIACEDKYIMTKSIAEDIPNRDLSSLALRIFIEKRLERVSSSYINAEIADFLFMVDQKISNRYEKGSAFRAILKTYATHLSNLYESEVYFMDIPLEDYLLYVNSKVLELFRSSGTSYAISQVEEPLLTVIEAYLSEFSLTPSILKKVCRVATHMRFAVNRYLAFSKILEAYVAKPDFDLDGALQLADFFVISSAGSPFVFKPYAVIARAYLTKPDSNLRQALSIVGRSQVHGNSVLLEIIKKYLADPNFDLDQVLTIAKMGHTREEKYFRESSYTPKRELFREIVKAYIKRPDFDLDRAIEIAKMSEDSKMFCESVKAYVARPNFDLDRAIKAAQQSPFPSESLYEVFEAYIARPNFDYKRARQIIRQFPPAGGFRRYEPKALLQQLYGYVPLQDRCRVM